MIRGDRIEDSEYGAGLSFSSVVSVRVGHSSQKLAKCLDSVGAMGGIGNKTVGLRSFNGHKTVRDSLGSWARHDDVCLLRA